MSKKIDNKKNVNNKRNSKSKKNVNKKKEYRFNIIMILLIVIFMVWGVLLLNRYNGYRNIKSKIDDLNMLENMIGFLNDNYDKIEDKVKKIDEFKDKNDLINGDIDKIKKEIEDLDYKLSKYSK